ncbi:unnamed protein product [Caretta caretta]
MLWKSSTQGQKQKCRNIKKSHLWYLWRDQECWNSRMEASVVSSLVLQTQEVWTVWRRERPRQSRRGSGSSQLTAVETPHFNTTHERDEEWAKTPFQLLEGLTGSSQKNMGENLAVSPTLPLPPSPDFTEIHLRS